MRESSLTLSTLFVKNACAILWKVQHSPGLHVVVTSSSTVVSHPTTSSFISRILLVSLKLPPLSRWIRRSRCLMRLEVGSNCPHASTLKRGQTHNIFSIYYEGDAEHLDFIAPNETIFSIWVDGLSVLSGNLKKILTLF